MAAIVAASLSDNSSVLLLKYVFEAASMPYDLLPKKFLLIYNSKISSLLISPSSCSAKKISLAFLVTVTSLVKR